MAGGVASVAGVATAMASRSPSRRAPTLRVERGYLTDGHVVVAGSDEVGRGSLGGPVTAGIVVVDDRTRRVPTGLRDSKLLTPTTREALVPKIQRWAVAHAVGHASAAEIDSLGLLAALRLAGERAIDMLDVELSVIVLDGNYDWFSRPPRAPQAPFARAPDTVALRIKADLTCASVAAASVLAKVERDGLMREMARDHPAYGWDINKGYATPDHMTALREVGPCVEHRRSWNLPGNDAQMALSLD